MHRPALSLAAAALLFLATPSAATPPTMTWLTRYQAGIGNNQTTGMVVDAAGNAYVTGQSYGASNHMEDFLTVKYAPAGGLTWTARYDGTNHGTDIAHALTLDPNGNVLVTGFSESGNDFDVLTIEYNASGATQWSNRYDFAPAHDEDEGVPVE